MLKLNLSEKGAEEILTREELKQIVGGTGSGSGDQFFPDDNMGSASDLCPDGQKLYHCTVDWGETSVTGVVCQRNALFAEVAVKETLEGQTGLPGASINVNCH